MARCIYDKQPGNLDFNFELLKKWTTEFSYSLRWEIASSDVLGLGPFSGTSPQLLEAEPRFLLSCPATWSCLSPHALTRQLWAAAEAHYLLPTCFQLYSEDLWFETTLKNLFLCPLLLAEYRRNVILPVLPLAIIGLAFGDIRLSSSLLLPVINSPLQLSWISSELQLTFLAFP